MEITRDAVEFHGDAEQPAGAVAMTDPGAADRGAARQPA